MVRPAVVAVSASARPLAERIVTALDGEIVDVREGAAETLRALFRDGRPIVGLCAAGILVRALAPLVADKQAEPPVVAVAEDGSVAVPLLGGHHGANDIARRIAALTGGVAAVTTASDVRFGVALDDPPPGYVLANPQHVKAFTARLLAGERVRVEGDALWLSPLPIAGDGALRISVTTRVVDGSEGHLVYHPKSLAVGAGASRGAPADDLVAVAERALGEHGLAPRSVAVLASIDLKADEPAIHALAGHFGVEARFFTAARLAEEEPDLANPSELVRREVGVAGVAEAAALAAAVGPRVKPEGVKELPGSNELMSSGFTRGPTGFAQSKAGRLIVEKTRSATGTVAIAESPAPIIDLPGRRRGRLSVVGIGPGTPDWRSPQASAALRDADDWVGYGLYLDLVADLARGQPQHRFPLGAEETRVRAALRLAAEGRNVALVSSGDAGIYAMAALACEVLDTPGLSDAERRVEIEIVPGISAFQAASARAGALIGHDFCCISLSDLLTPWEEIERRLHAAAQGDFVVAFYNPRSERREDRLGRALAILRRHRPPATPVAVASNLGRPDEAVNVTDIARLDPAQVDMLTLVLVGASSSRVVQRGDGSVLAYTPRGYEKKRQAS